MVLSPSPADPRAAARPLKGFERVERTLRLSRDGVLVAVRAPWLASIAAATRRLHAIDDALAVVERFEEMRAAARPGRLLLWHLRPDEAGIANLYRDLIKEKRLRVVLWFEPAAERQLRHAAPDLFDWVRTTISLPDAPPQPLVDAFAAARGRPGIVWYGPGLQTVAALQRPARRLWHSEATDDYRATAQRVGGLSPRECAVWQARTPADVWRIRWAHAEHRRHNGIVLQPPAHLELPGWVSLGTDTTLTPTIERLVALGFDRPGFVAALCGAQHGQLAALAAQVEAGADHSELTRALLNGPAIEQLPWGMGAATPAGIRRLRRRVDRWIRRGEWPPLDALWFRVSHLTPRGEGVAQRLLELIPEGPAALALQVEASLRAGIDPWPGWRARAAQALGRAGAAEHWATTPGELPADVHLRLAHIRALDLWTRTLTRDTIGRWFSGDAPPTAEAVEWLANLADLLAETAPGSAFWATCRATMHALSESYEGALSWAAVGAALDQALPPAGEGEDGVALARVVLDAIRADALSIEDRLEMAAAGLERLDTGLQLTHALRKTAGSLRQAPEDQGAKLAMAARLVHVWSTFFDGLRAGSGDFLQLMLGAARGHAWTPSHTLRAQRSLVGTLGMPAPILDSMSAALTSLGQLDGATDLRRVAIREARREMWGKAQQLVAHVPVDPAPAARATAVANLDRQALSPDTPVEKARAFAAIAAALDPSGDRLRRMEIDTEMPASFVALAQCLREQWNAERTPLDPDEHG